MQIQAVFESGVIRPLEPIELPEGELIEVIVLLRNGKESIEVEELEMAAEGLVRLPTEDLPESFWEMDAPVVTQEDIIAAVRAERDED